MRLFGLALVCACAPPLPEGEVRECRPATRAGCPTPSGETFVDPVRHLGRGESSEFIEITDVVPVDELVYACTGVRGLMVWDASADAPRRLVEGIAPDDLSHSSYPRCQHVSVDGNRVAITNRGDEIQPEPWLHVYDVTDPARPADIAGWQPPTGSVEGVVLVGDRMYVARHTAGISVLDVGSTLTELGNFNDDVSDAWLPVKSGDTLVVAEGATGLRTYDVASDEPVLLATLALPGSSRDVVLEGSRAFVATSSGVAAVDITDPAAPELLGEIATDGTSLALDLAGPATVVVAEWDEMRGYDFTDPTAPVAAFSEVVPTNDPFSRVLAVGAAPARGRVFAGEWAGLHQFELVDGHGPDVLAAPQSLQFGTVPDGDSETAVLVVRNRGDAPLTVHDIASADVVSVDQDCFQLDPGGAQAIEVTVAPAGLGDLRSEVVVCSDDPDEPRHSVSLSVNISGVDVGDPVPRFSLADTTGAVWTSDALLGNVVVLAYFATF